MKQFALIIKAFSKSEGKLLLDNEDDEAEFSVDLLSNLANETDEEKDVREKSQKEDRINWVVNKLNQKGVTVCFNESDLP